ncbi:hypothetical protein R3P38DRAFT_2576116 [Favolaschia claudopus]|uniref:Uncharacterized protein n=1 Tax=Favolaschia claudopus TaxID=2862362 RepID=A0AAV9ZIS8_9AGAR
MDLDVEDLEAAFVPADWIGKRKKYSEDLPASVIAAKNAVFSCPTSATEIVIADRNVPVLKFVEMVLPHVSSELVYGESGMWFSDDEPTSDIAVLRSRNIPPRRVLDELARKSGQAWLNGARSVSDPRYNDGGDRFPLYALALWTEMSKMIEEQRSWKRSIEWLAKQREKCQDDLTKEIIDKYGPDSEKAKERSLRQQLIRKFHLALKEEQDTATGTGLERAARWRASAPGGSESKTAEKAALAGNAANAALAATAIENFFDAAAKRKTIFTKAGVPSLPEVIAARVTPLRPISIGDFGVIYTSRGLMGGGKYGKHEPVTESSNISALSKISVQVYEHGHGAQFRSIPTATAVVQTKQFAHIQPYQFICLLSGSPKTIPSGVELRLEDANRFKLLLRGSAKFEVAKKLFRKRGKKSADGAGEDSGEEGDE